MRRLRKNETGSECRSSYVGDFARAVHVVHSLSTWMENGPHVQIIRLAAFLFDASPCRIRCYETCRGVVMGRSIAIEFCVIQMMQIMEPQGHLRKLNVENDSGPQQ